MLWGTQVVLLRCTPLQSASLWWCFYLQSASLWCFYLQSASLWCFYLQSAFLWCFVFTCSLLSCDAVLCICVPCQNVNSLVGFVLYVVRYCLWTNIHPVLQHPYNKHIYASLYTWHTITARLRGSVLGECRQLGHMCCLIGRTRTNRVI